MSRKSRVLLVDDDLMLQKLIPHQLTRAGMHAVAVGSGAEAFAALQRNEYDVVLLDVNLQDTSGLEILTQLRQIEDAPEVIMLTSDATLPTGIKAMRLGAYDYLTKPADREEMEAVIAKATEKRRLVRQNVNLKAAVQPAFDRRPSTVIYRSAVMAALLRQAEAAARLDTTILITGESGTGKDVLARHAHAHGTRCREPLITVNCGALPETLFESEFFGHERGSFTGANTLKRGIVESADDGTLFLDEIGDLPLPVQVKFLHLLEHGTFRRIGATREQEIDVRIIAATNRNLLEDVDNGRFRADLFYRLNVISLHVPPLRERPEDIQPLAEHFLTRYRQRFTRPGLEFTPAALQALTAYPWPGNIRELRNLVERAVALAAGAVITPEDLYLKPTTATPSAKTAEPVSQIKEMLTLEDMERRHILHVLELHKQNRERTATALGITTRTLYRKLQEYAQ